MNGSYGIQPGLKVVITAGAAGIGRAIAEAFDSVEAKIHVCDISQEAIDSCKKDHPEWGYTLCDVSKDEQVKNLINEAADSMGGLDVLINNAGIAGPTAPVEDMNPADWDATININLNSQFYATHYAVPFLKKSNQASIICISSVAGRLAYKFRSPYAATKWAVRGFAESLAYELGPYNIRVNAVLPGIVAGPRIENVIRARAENDNVPFEEMESYYKNMASLGRMVTAQDVANQVLFLCSPVGQNISGQSISVDGHVRAL